MRSVLRRFLLVAVLLSASVSGLSHFLLSRYVAKPEFRALAEEKLSEFFQSRVQVGGIGVRFFNRIVFRDIQISPKDAQTEKFSFRVNKIIFQYNLLQIFTRRLLTPERVSLNTPEFKVDGNIVPYDLLRQIHFGAGISSLSHLELSGGSFKVQMLDAANDISLSQLSGAIKPNFEGKVQIHFKAQASGFIQGRIAIQGEIDPVHRTHYLQLALEGASAGESMPLPLENMRGVLIWKDNEVNFEELKVSVHGWESTLKGKFLIGEKPLLAFTWEIGKSDPRFIFSLSADLASKTLEGVCVPLNHQTFRFHGRIENEGKLFRLDQLVMNQEYKGQGQFDYGTGNTEIYLEKDNQRVGIKTNLKDLAIRLNFDLDHMKVYGMDLVTKAEMNLRPAVQRLQDRVWRFIGDFHTDYFVLEQIPLNDFHGGFEVSPAELSDLRAGWGQVFELSGNLMFHRQTPECHLQIKVEDFDLSMVQQLASRPLPKDLGGYLEGKITLAGALARPEISGAFSIRSGRLGRLQYDRGIIHFRGFPPYLALNDSRILKGRNTLFLNGAINLGISNIFHGIEIQTSDKLVIWRGWEMNLSGAEKDLEIDPAIKGVPTLALKAGLLSEGNSSEEQDANNRERYVAAGAKLKF